MTETRDGRRERKQAEARGIEQFREHVGNPAPLTMTPQAVYHWNRDDQADALAAAREAEPDTGFMMRLLALCTLPRTNPGNRDKYIRRNGPFTLVMTATGTAKLPYGTLPRLLLAWVCTEAVRSQSRTLVLGRSLAEFMRTLGLHPSGGSQRGDRIRLQNQMQRLFNASVQLVYERDGRSVSVGSLVADRTDFWWDPRRPEDPVLWDSTIELGEKFFNEIIACPVPLDVNVLKAIKRSPLGLDLYLWLTYRLFGLGEPLSLTWRQLYRQFGSNPVADRRTVDDFRKDVLRELGSSRTHGLVSSTAPRGLSQAETDAAAHRPQPSRSRESSPRRHGPHDAAPARVPGPRRASGAARARAHRRAGGDGQDGCGPRRDLLRRRHGDRRNQCRSRPGDGTALRPLNAPESGGRIGVVKRPDNGRIGVVKRPTTARDRSGETPDNGRIGVVKRPDNVQVDQSK